MIFKFIWLYYTFVYLESQMCFDWFQYTTAITHQTNISFVEIQLFDTIVPMDKAYFRENHVALCRFTIFNIAL